MQRSMRAARPRGVTLVETLVVVAVLAVLLAAAAPSFRDGIEQRRVRGHADVLANDLRFARSEALARSTPVRLSVASDADGSCYVLHIGHCTCDGAGQTECAHDAQALKSVHLPPEAVRLRSNVTSLLFDAARNTVTPAGSLDIVGPSGRALRQVVSVTGRVRTCSPNGTVAGHPRC